MKLLVLMMIFAYMILSAVMSSYGEWEVVCLFIGLFTLSVCAMGIMEAIEGVKK